MVARRFLLSLLAVAALGAGCGKAHIKKTDAAYEALRAGNVEEANANFEAALKKNPSYAPALNGLGKLAYDRKDYDAAKGYFDRVLQAESRNVEALWGRGKVNLRRVEYTDAARDLAEAVDAGKAEANLDLGYALMLTGDATGAMEAFDDYRKVSASEADRLRAMLGAYRSGIKFEMLGEARKVVEGYVFDDNAAKSTRSRALADLAYASSDFRIASENASKAGSSQDFGFGVRELSPGAARSFEGVGGAVVDWVHVGSPADRAGLLPGDIVTAFETVRVTSAAQLTDALKAFAGKQQAQKDALIEVLRDDDAFYAVRMTVGAYDTAGYIRQAEASGTPQPLKVAADELAQWP